MGLTNMLKLDYFTMKANLKSYSAAIIFVLAFFAMDTSLELLLINCSWYAALISINIFAIEEKNDLKRLYGMLSLRVKDIVLGRYLFMYLSYFVVVVVVLGTSIIFSKLALFGSRFVNLDRVFLSISVSALIFSAILNLQAPLFFKLGYNKGRFYAMLPFVGIIGLATLPNLLGHTIPLFTLVMQYQMISSVVMILLSIIIFGVSSGLSYLLYER